jgi:hypothetical protein
MRKLGVNQVAVEKDDKSGPKFWKTAPGDLARHQVCERGGITRLGRPDRH